MEAVAFAPFPRGRHPIPPLSVRLAALGVALRPASGADLGFLRRLYAEMRAPELILAPYSAAEKAAFCDNQFALQHRHYVQFSPKADFWTVTQAAGDIGRLTLERADRIWRIIEIVLSVETRGRGLGSALIEWVQASAAEAGAESVTLSVAIANARAQGLYRRLGFRDCSGGDPLHVAMEWQPGAA